MTSFRRVAASVAAVSTLFSATCSAAMVPGSYEEPTTGLNFTTWTAEANTDGDGGMTFGIALPADAASTDATEYIGYLKCASTSAEETGWCGITHDGQMTGGLLLVAWPSADQVLTSFRMADGYAMPGVYPGSSTLTQISSSVTDAGYEVVFRCEGCLAWTDAGGAEVTAGTSEGNFMLGYAQGRDTPVNAACPDEVGLEYHTLGFNLWSASTEGLVVEDYEGAAELATEVVEGECDAVPAPSGSASPSGTAPSGTAPAGTAPSAA